MEKIYTMAHSKNSFTRQIEHTHGKNIKIKTTHEKEGTNRKSTHAAHFILYPPTIQWSSIIYNWY